MPLPAKELQHICTYRDYSRNQSIISANITVKNLSALLFKSRVYQVQENNETETTVPAMSTNLKKFELLLRNVINHFLFHFKPPTGNGPTLTKTSNIFDFKYVSCTIVNTEKLCVPQ